VVNYNSQELQSPNSSTISAHSLDWF